jgi:hypothetical protein
LSFQAGTKKVNSPLFAPDIKTTSSAHDQGTDQRTEQRNTNIKEPTKREVNPPQLPGGGPAVGQAHFNRHNPQTATGNTNGPPATQAAEDGDALNVISCIRARATRKAPAPAAVGPLDSSNTRSRFRRVGPRQLRGRDKPTPKGHTPPEAPGASTCNDPYPPPQDPR